MARAFIRCTACGNLIERKQLAKHITKHHDEATDVVVSVRGLLDEHESRRQAAVATKRKTIIGWRSRWVA